MSVTSEEWQAFCSAHGLCHIAKKPKEIQRQMNLASTTDNELGQQVQRDPAATSWSISELRERRRSTNTKMPTYELYTPDEVDGGLYARVKLERKEREEMKIQEGTMVETEFKDIQTTWDELRSDINASVVSNHSLSKLFVETIPRLLALRNHYSATAILAGLCDSGVDRKTLPCLPLLDTTDDYTIYRAFVSSEPGLPLKKEGYRTGQPKLWLAIPTAIIQMYGPTKLQDMPSLGYLSTFDLPQCIDILPSPAFDFAHPPTEKALPTT
ncbi:hypothetical protein V496_03612 [Pseudogymnoascus sp. VKM F-4515 (FW-2607)]|nr:hypothetical protein V496_03612 [Pseudogymnoascus sp. VKM F-4515 (FW-2607)]